MFVEAMKLSLLFALMAAVVFLVSALAAEPERYPGYDQDRLLLRKTELIREQNTKASSGEAVTAAIRLFEKIDFMGLTRGHVLAILGDPRTISDYGISAGKDADSPLTYMFDTGWGGWQFSIEFTDGRVRKVIKTGLN